MLSLTQNLYDPQNHPLTKPAIMTIRKSCRSPFLIAPLLGTAFGCLSLVGPSSLLAQKTAGSVPQYDLRNGGQGIVRQSPDEPDQPGIAGVKDKDNEKLLRDDSDRSSGKDSETDSREAYGPGPCEPRKTLFQWSYGTGFSGGPDLDEPLVTDRPDFTEASSTVGLGVVQVEIGYTYTFDNDGSIQSISHSAPESLLRYGIGADWLEFRVGWNYLDEEIDGVAASGGEDLYLGFKIGLTPQEDILPEMALVPQMTAPTGTDAFSADEVLPGLNWTYGWELNERISTAGSTQFNRNVDDGSGEAYTEWAQSWTIAYSLTEKVGAYTEWFALFPHSSETVLPEHYFNGGFTRLFCNDVQWDIRAGLGLNEAADDYFVGTGLSMRFR